jgi:hypothetical protein
MENEMSSTVYEDATTFEVDHNNKILSAMKFSDGRFMVDIEEDNGYTFGVSSLILSSEEAVRLKNFLLKNY